jgi:hypothetical protein
MIRPAAPVSFDLSRASAIHFLKETLAGALHLRGKIGIA